MTSDEGLAICHYHLTMLSYACEPITILIDKVTMIVNLPMKTTELIMIPPLTQHHHITTQTFDW